MLGRQLDVFGRVVRDQRRLIALFKAVRSTPWTRRIVVALSGRPRAPMVIPANIASR